jgi:hypothetical protein
MSGSLCPESFNRTIQPAANHSQGEQAAPDHEERGWFRHGRNRRLEEIDYDGAVIGVRKTLDKACEARIDVGSAAGGSQRRAGLYVLTSAIASAIATTAACSSIASSTAPAVSTAGKANSYREAVPARQVAEVIPALPGFGVRDRRRRPISRVPAAAASAECEQAGLTPIWPEISDRGIPTGAITTCAAPTPCDEQ